MIDRLTAMLTDIGDQTIAIMRKSLVLGDQLRSANERYHRVTVEVGTVHRLKVCTRQHQDVRRCNRLDIANGKHRFVFVHHGGRNLTSNDAAEDTLARGHTVFPSLSDQTCTRGRPLPSTSGWRAIMPELPEVETVRRTLQRLVVGECIVGIDINWHRTLVNDSEPLRQRLQGACIIEVDRRAKLILLRLNTGDSLSVHLRMTGELLVLEEGEPADEARQKHLSAVLRFASGRALHFYDTRKFGRWQIILPDGHTDVDARFGIEPLSDAFSADWMMNMLVTRKRMMKPLLLDQTVIAGIGNIYADEALHRAGVHPLTRSDTVDQTHAACLHEAIRTVLATAIEHRGTTLRDYRTGDGASGENQARLQVYGRGAGAPCYTCGTALVRLVVGQRGTMLCPTCQPLVASSSGAN